MLLSTEGLPGPVMVKKFGKPLVNSALTLALVTATAKATLAHVDSLGQPDPYWQQIANATITGASVFQLEAGLDTGPVYGTLSEPIVQ